MFWDLGGIPYRLSLDLKLDLAMCILRILVRLSCMSPNTCNVGA